MNFLGSRVRLDRSRKFCLVIRIERAGKSVHASSQFEFRKIKHRHTHEVDRGFYVTPFAPNDLHDALRATAESRVTQELAPILLFIRYKIC